jgi:hypothetical protein
MGDARASRVVCSALRLCLVLRLMNDGMRWKLPRYIHQTILSSSLYKYEMEASMDKRDEHIVIIFV